MDNKYFRFDGKPRRDLLRETGKVVISSHLVCERHGHAWPNGDRMLAMAASVSIYDLVYPSTSNGLCGWERACERWVFSYRSCPDCRSAGVPAQLAERG